MRFVILAASCAAIAFGPVAAKEKKPENPDKKICKFEAQSASRFAKKVCKTAAEWKALQEDSAKGVDATYRPVPTSN